MVKARRGFVLCHERKLRVLKEVLDRKLDQSTNHPRTIVNRVLNVKMRRSTKGRVTRVKVRRKGSRQRKRSSTDQDEASCREGLLEIAIKERDGNKKLSKRDNNTLKLYIARRDQRAYTAGMANPLVNKNSSIQLAEFIPILVTNPIEGRHVQASTKKSCPEEKYFTVLLRKELKEEINKLAVPDEKDKRKQGYDIMTKVTSGVTAWYQGHEVGYGLAVDSRSWMLHIRDANFLPTTVIRLKYDSPTAPPTNLRFDYIVNGTVTRGMKVMIMKIDEGGVGRITREDNPEDIPITIPNGMTGLQLIPFSWENGDHQIFFKIGYDPPEYRVGKWSGFVEPGEDPIPLPQKMTGRAKKSSVLKEPPIRQQRNFGGLKQKTDSTSERCGKEEVRTTREVAKENDDDRKKEKKTVEPEVLKPKIPPIQRTARKTTYPGKGNKVAPKRILASESSGPSVELMAKIGNPNLVLERVRLEDWMQKKPELKQKESDPKQK